jgi:hypothetical protein
MKALIALALAITLALLIMWSPEPLPDCDDTLTDNWERIGYKDGAWIMDGTSCAYYK